MKKKISIYETKYKAKVKNKERGRIKTAIIIYV